MFEIRRDPAGYSACEAPVALTSEAAIGRSVVVEWPQLRTWSSDSCWWYEPSSVVLYTDGSWALAIARLYNGYDSYGPFERKYSVTWSIEIDYHNAQGSILSQSRFDVGTEGYQGSTSNIVRNFADGNYLQWKDQIRQVGFRRRLRFHY